MNHSCVCRREDNSVWLIAPKLAYVPKLLHPVTCFFWMCQTRVYEF